ncbi:DUF192 domain-containing protein [Hydromonas duriensis]|uniref:Uncharacterized membrane protein (UPF0127 family) n=1 Tax=Hydromonas duriensis TaxID=1527608 RepID=A0A4R6Y5N7_9BURK|nr:DUF192 domain-containing protein [Hydromonas duriensis]TDR30768.1 uncharacterized membrane protein (UPF0127 family) [Hydromonas duriensis]
MKLKLNGSFAFTLFLSVSLLQACQNTVQNEKQSLSETRFVALNQLKNIKLEVADDDAKRQVGLMNRPSMADNAGMLFVFDEEKPYCFWMKNTLIPLTVGFLDVNGVLVQTEDMQPQTEVVHCARSAVKYAVEMNQNWFKSQNVEVGTQLLKVSP